jgi:hypothetical protein
MGSPPPGPLRTVNALRNSKSSNFQLLSTCRFLCVAFFMSLSTCHSLSTCCFRCVAFNMLLTCRFHRVAFDMSLALDMLLSMCHFRHVTFDMSLSTCHFLTCHFRHVQFKCVWFRCVDCDLFNYDFFAFVGSLSTFSPLLIWISKSDGHAPECRNKNKKTENPSSPYPRALY